MIKVQGRSFTKEFVYCVACEGKFVWLRAESYVYGRGKGYYYAICSKCRKVEKQRERAFGEANKK